MSIDWRGYGTIPPRTHPLGKLLRLPLALLPRDSVVPILAGPLRGKKWVVGSSVHGCWFGSYESQKQRFVAEALRPGQVVYDVGANVGLYSLLASGAVGPNGSVFAFEPVTENVFYLERHLALNGISNCTIVRAAACAQDGTRQFDLLDDRSRGRLSADGTESVPTIRLDSFHEADRERRRPHFVKIDVEGGEAEVLEGAVALLKENSLIVSVATHSAELDVYCTRLLTSLGYCVRQIGAYDLWATKD
jgi:FkbM family methyltransferase